MPEPAARNARAEAQALLPDGFEARVLEPSPPAVHDDDSFADDPTDPSGAAPGVKVVGPTSDADITWDAYAAEHPEVAGYAADHWLGAYKRLQPLPPDFAAVRDDLHQVAFYAVAPARHAANGKIALRYTYGGFGTPFYGDDVQARVEGVDLVVQRGDAVRSERITTVRAATEFLGVDYKEVWFPDFHDPLKPTDPDRPLQVSEAAVAALADWFGFAYSVLEESRRMEGAEQVSRVQLWPEHFDPAFESGDYEAGRRASYGASPGDGAHPEPYLYVAVWSEIDRSNPYWNDTTFNGASLSYQELLAADDPRQAALDFYRRGFEVLHS